MLKAISRDHRLVVLGLSEANLQRLRTLEPIMADLGELDPALAGHGVVVLWGATAADRRRMVPALLVAATRAGGSGQLVVLGVGDHELAKLRAGFPILADSGGLPAGVRVVLFWGPTEEQMEAELAPLLKGAERIYRGPGGHGGGRHTPRE